MTPDISDQIDAARKVREKVQATADAFKAAADAAQHTSEGIAAEGNALRAQIAALEKYRADILAAESEAAASLVAARQLDAASAASREAGAGAAARGQEARARLAPMLQAAGQLPAARQAVATADAAVAAAQAALNAHLQNEPEGPIDDGGLHPRRPSPAYIAWQSKLRSLQAGLNSARANANARRGEAVALEAAAAGAPAVQAQAEAEERSAADSNRLADQQGAQAAAARARAGDAQRRRDALVAQRAEILGAKQAAAAAEAKWQAAVAALDAHLTTRPAPRRTAPTRPRMVPRKLADGDWNEPDTTEPAVDPATEAWNAKLDELTRAVQATRAAADAAASAVNTFAGIDAEIQQLMLAVRGKDAQAGYFAGEMRAQLAEYQRVMAVVGQVDARIAALTARHAARPADAVLVGTLPTDAPVALLPVRLETRFVTAGADTNLLVRIYPDDIQADTHEPALTAEEESYGRAFWDGAWRAAGDPARETVHWERVAGRFGSARAEWIVEALRPKNQASRPRTAVADGVTLSPKPSFPTVARRASVWERAAQARGLPTRWVLIGYRGGRRAFTAWGNPLPPTVAVGPSPAAGGVPNGGIVDAGMRWMVDFAEAERIGMAVTVRLLPEHASGLDRLIAIGLRGSDTTGAALEELLRAQRYTRGAGLLGQGTPTNNSRSSGSGWSARGADAMPPGLVTGAASGAPGDAASLARALGVDARAIDGTDSAGRDEQGDAAAMNTALWSVGWGYFLATLLGGALPADTIDRVRWQFVNHVRGRGSVPLLRIGRQPYGVLPVAPLESWAPRAAPAGDGGPTDGETAEMVRVLRLLRQLWRRSLAGVPRVGRPQTAADAQLTPAERASRRQAALLDALQMQPMSSRYALRDVVAGHKRDRLTGDLYNAVPQARAALQALGLGAFPPLLGTVQRVTGDVFAGPLVSPEAPGDAPLAVNYLARLRKATHAALRGDSYWTAPALQRPLLDVLLRHAMLLEEAWAAFRSGVAARTVRRDAWTDPADLDAATMTPLRFLDRRDLFESGGKTAGEYLHGLLADPRARRPAQMQQLDEFMASVARLESLSTASLARLLPETLDLSSYRLDAWISSLASRRLAAMRSAKPRGAYLGAYGWVEDLAPRASGPASDGFIHAPSVAQSATAAVLRSGYLSQGSADDENPFAIDLSSERVRLATSVLASVREGLPLSTILGYRFERSLHDRGLDRYIRAFRRLVPVEGGDAGRLMAANAAFDSALAARDAARSASADAEARFHAEEQRLASSRALVVQLEARIPQEAALRAAVDAAITKRDAAIDVRDTLLGEPPERYIDDTNTGKPVYNKNYTAKLREWNEAVGDANAAIAAANAKVTAAQGALNAFLAAAAATSLADARAAVTSGEALVSARNKEWAAQNVIRDTREQELTAARTALMTVSESVYGGASETMAASQVVNGVALRQRFRSGEKQSLWTLATIPFGDKAFTFDPVNNAPALPVATSGEGLALRAALRDIDDALDATGDALVAEGVHQLVQGNPVRAGAAIDAIAIGKGSGDDILPLPELEVARTPRSGAAQTHRVIALFGGAAPKPAGWKVDARNIRARAEPWLDAWVATLLGDPARFQCRVTFVDPANGSPLPGRAPVTVKLSALGLSPLDLVALPPSSGEAQRSELEERVRYVALRTLPAGAPAADARVDLARDASWPATALGFRELLEIVRTARALVQGARPLDARDLGVAGTVPADGVDVAELTARVDAVVVALKAAHAALPAPTATPVGLVAESVRSALMAAAAFGIGGAIPVAPRDSRDPVAQEHIVLQLLDQGWTVAKEAQRRLDLIAEERAGSGGSTPAAIRAQLDRVAALAFGGDARILPLFQAPTSRKDITTSFGKASALYGGDEGEVVRWFQRTTRVREGTARLDEALAYARAIDAPARTSFQVAQLPLGAGGAVERWIALPFAAGARPKAQLSLVVHAPKPIPVTAALRGVLIDEWVEVVPAARETTGVAFQFDEPNARAPQAILLGVPADTRPVWTLDALEQTVLDALDLAQLRAVDADAIAADVARNGGDRQDAMTGVQFLLPALYVAHNENVVNNVAAPPDTVSTVFPRVAAAAT